MKRASQTTRRAIAILVFAALVLGTLFVGRDLGLQSRSRLSCCVQDGRTGGGLALFRALRQMDYTIVPLRVPIWEAGAELPGIGNTIITAGNGSWSPFKEEMDPDHVQSLCDWVTLGNSLVIITTHVDCLPESLKEPFANASADAVWDVTRNRVEGYSDSDEEDIWTTDGNSRVEKSRHTDLASTVWGVPMRVRPNGPRCHGLHDENSLARVHDADVLVSVSLGKGRIVVCLDDVAWTNAGLELAGNAAALVHVLGESGRTGIIAVDEYRHGHGRVESFVTHLFTLRGAESVAMMSGILIGLVMIGLNIRLGPAEAYFEEERRTAKEYVEAVADMNQRARAAPLAVEAVARRIAQLARHRGRLSDEGSQLLERADQLVEQGDRPRTPREEVRLVGEMIRLRKALYGTGTDS